MVTVAQPSEINIIVDFLINFVKDNIFVNSFYMSHKVESAHAM